MKRERYSSTLIGTFDFLFSIMDITTREMAEKEIKNLNNADSQQDVTDIHRTHHSRIHTLLKCTQNTPQDKLYTRP